MIGDIQVLCLHHLSVFVYLLGVAVAGMMSCRVWRRGLFGVFYIEFCGAEGVSTVDSVMQDVLRIGRSILPVIVLYSTKINSV